MTGDGLAGVIRRLHRASFARDSTRTDGQLLQSYLDRSEEAEAAFAALVQRHGPMVLGVCHRILRHAQDAEDAFQATFLVLSRKAGSVVPRELVGNWLYGVAYRTALKARTVAGRRRARERQVQEMPDQAAAEDRGQELVPLLDGELSALPDRYRVAVVLCDLEGKTKREAARRLGWPEGTVSSRLARGRRLLAERLARRGIALGTVGLATALSHHAAPAAVSAQLVARTVRAAMTFAAGKAVAAGVVSAQAVALSEGVLKTMLLSKLRIAVALLLGLVLIVASTGVVLRQAPAAEREEPPRAGEKAAGTPQADGKGAQTAPAQTAAKRFENAPGWTWHIAPRGKPMLMSSSGLVFLAESEKPSGALLVTLAHPCGGKQGELKYRPVAFDAAGKRYALKQDTGGSSTTSTGEGAALSRFHLDLGDLAADKVKDLGVEVLKPEGRDLAAAQGQKQAKAAGIEVLPLPEVGRAFDFALTTMDGKKVRSDELRGKVVLIDWWASWCGPCIAKMPELKELYESHHKDGLEVVGVCFDEDAEKAKKTIKRLGLTWPQVLVPPDEKARDVWQEATDLRSLPRLLLIDRKGVLRAECTPQEMEEQITKLLHERPTKD